MRRLLAAAAALTLAACGNLGGGPTPATSQSDAFRASHPFSGNPIGLAVPEGWQNWLFGPLKPPTQYLTDLDTGTGQVVVHAHAVRSASALLRPLNPLNPQPRYVRWRWRAQGMIDGAVLSEASGEDAPVRLLLGFQGDTSKLSFHDLMFAERVKLMSGQEMPYATLMYVWSNHEAVESIVSNPHTGRIRMLVVDQGPSNVGVWQNYTREIAADFRRAFGEDPGPLVMVGIMTDTDNTGTTVDADYGDIRLYGAGIPATGLPPEAPHTP